MNVITTRDVGRRFGKSWALRHIDVEVPENAVVGLVGPNGAGKSTLLHLVAGLVAPSEGTVTVLGRRPGTPELLADVAFVAQDAPLPRRARVRELISLARALNVRWDDDIVRERCDELGLRDDQRVAELSGGQRAQLALALALAKRPRLLVLDEPVASLDPLARRGFLQTLMASMAERELSLVFSTHLLDDLERTCDHLIVLSNGAIRLARPIEDILHDHAVLIGPADRPLPPGAIPVHRDVTQRHHQQLVTVDRPIHDPAWQLLAPNLEEIVLAHLAVETTPRRLEAV